MSKKCIYCGNTDFINIAKNQDYISGEIFQVERCKICGLARTAQAPIELSKYYTNKYYGSQGKRFNPVIEWLIFLSRRARALSLMKQSTLPGSILDIGCGRGIMLKILKGEGWQTTGIEFNDELANYANNNLGIKVRVTPNLKECELQAGSFDAVTMYHVLEHIQNPYETVIEIFRILKPGGFFTLEAPNLFSIQYSLAKGRWFHLDAPRHLYHFSQKSLRGILLKAGFVIEKTNTHSIEYGYFGMIQSFLNLFCQKMNAFYDLLKNKSTAPPKSINTDTLISFGLLIPITIISLPLEFMASLLGRGGIIRIIARKTK